MKDFTQNYKFKLGVEEPSSDASSYYHVQNENVELEVEPKDISLKSFQLHNHLANNIWHGSQLDERVRLTLLDIADDFWDSCNIRWTKPCGLILTGSICNFNWSDCSDIDLHLIVDFNDIHPKQDFVQEYFDEKKNDWNNNHKHLNLFGYAVELYVQNIDCDIESSGIYDIYNKKWFKEPDLDKFSKSKLDTHKIKLISSYIMTEIDDLVNEFKKENDKDKIEHLNNKCSILLGKIRKIRKNGLKKSEMSNGNIIYKCLRRSNYLDKLWRLENEMYDKIKSIDESLSFETQILKEF